MAASRDRDGWIILPRTRMEALRSVIELRGEAMAAGKLPDARDWPLPPCPECHSTVERWGSSTGHGVPLKLWFDPCGHAFVSDGPEPLSRRS